MKFTTASVGTLLLSTAAAHPNAARREALANRGNKLAFNLAQTHKKPVDSTGNKFDSSDSFYSGYTAISSGIKTVTGTVIVPNVTTPPGAQSGVDYYNAIWVGVQGTSGSLWQAGLQTIASLNQPTSYIMFWEEANNLPPAGLSGAFSYGPGDTLVMTVTVTGSNSGNATVVNPTTGQTAFITKTGLSAEIATTNANWIVEDPGPTSSGNGPFAAWSGGWQWSDCSYSTGSGPISNFSGDQTVEVTIDGTDVTQVNPISSSSFSVTFIGTSTQTGEE